MFRPLLLTDVDKATIKKLIEIENIEKIFSYVNELAYQSYQNGISEGFSRQSETSNLLIGKLSAEVNQLRQFAPPFPMRALGEERQKVKKL